MNPAVRRATPSDEPAAAAIVAEYNEAIGVVLRDDPAALRAYLAGPGALWLAEDQGIAVGCVALRPLPDLADVTLSLSKGAEVKRLYVRPAYRGLRLAGALMDALEAHARDAGYAALYLDTKDDLHAAIRFYDRRGYERIPRYNDNPQATIFMRRLLSP